MDKITYSWEKGKMELAGTKLYIIHPVFMSQTNSSWAQPTHCPDNRGRKHL
jgi:hypothetical protein